MTSTGETANELTRRLVIMNERGLHARAAAKFVTVLTDFDAEIDVEKDGVRVSGRSIMGLMMLAAAPGTTIEVTGKGPDALEALAVLTQLVEDRFDE